MVSAFDFDAAILALNDAARQLKTPRVGASGEMPPFIVAYEAVNRAGRDLTRLAYLVADDELRRRALELLPIGFGQRALIQPDGSFAGDFGIVRQARDAVAVRAAELVKKI
jgi:hypothetical protein